MVGTDRLQFQNLSSLVVDETDVRTERVIHTFHQVHNPTLMTINDTIQLPLLRFNATLVIGRELILFFQLYEQFCETRENDG